MPQLGGADRGDDLLDKLSVARAYIDRRMANVQADPNGHPLDIDDAQIALDKIDAVEHPPNKNPPHLANHSPHLPRRG